eukprot:XP_014041900.1 PREDICTED: zinc finger CCHC domain-containing protein 7-like [Salmo salar]
MFAGYVDRAELEDELYGEESEGSEVEDSELQFRLYSQLHYSSNPGEKEEEDEDRRLSSSHGEKEEEEEEDRRLSSSHGENPGEEEEEDGRKAKRKQPSKSRDHGNRDLRQHLVGHTEQKKLQVKPNRKQQRGDPRLQRSFQEVIVIDSSQDDVITVSDNTEEDDGVCSAKGQRLKKGSLQASTPAPQRKSAPKRRSSSVDSDSLESWMILGSGKQDGDQSIILNLEGDLKDGDDGTWLITDRDRKAQIVNRRGGGPPGKRVANRYYADKKVTCRTCKKNGHLSKSCPTPREPCCVLCGERGHVMSSCPSKHCSNCGLPGHVYEACIGPHLRFKYCRRCGVQGHINDACPEIWRQYHITTKPGPVLKVEGEDNARMNPCCYNCSVRGHFGFDCSVKRMFGGFRPNSSFINHYDASWELHSRDRRAQSRVKELKEAGLFQCQLSPDGGARDEPPAKRQRTNSNRVSSPYQNYPAEPSHLPPCLGASSNRTHFRFGRGQVKPWTPKHKLKDHLTPVMGF